MQYTRQELVEWVQSRIDELSAIEQVSPIPPNIIERELDESATQVLRTAKKQLVYPAGKSYRTPVLVSTRPDRSNVQKPYSIIIPLPDTFIRFIRLRLSPWKIPIDDITTADDSAYKRQTNYFHKGTSYTPFAAIIPFYFEYTPADKAKVVYTQAIEAFPAPDSVSTLYYNSTGDAGAVDEAFKAAAVLAGYNRAIFDASAVTPQTAVVAEMAIIEQMPAEKVPEILTDTLVWYAAGRCLTSLRKADLAQAAYQNSQIAMSGVKIGLKNEEA